MSETYKTEGEPAELRPDEEIIRDIAARQKRPVSDIWHNGPESGEIDLDWSQVPQDAFFDYVRNKVHGEGRDINVKPVSLGFELRNPPYLSLRGAKRRSNLLIFQGIAAPCGARNDDIE